MRTVVGAFKSNSQFRVWQTSDISKHTASARIDGQMER
jgi:hypothetical protein